LDPGPTVEVSFRKVDFRGHKVVEEGQVMATDPSLAVLRVAEPTRASPAGLEVGSGVRIGR
jgi:hypothetical protein